MATSLLSIQLCGFPYIVTCSQFAVEVMLLMENSHFVTNGKYLKKYSASISQHKDKLYHYMPHWYVFK